MKTVNVYRKEYYAEIPAEAEINEIEFLYQASTYDEAGNLLQEITYNQEKEIVHTYKYSYDAQNHITEELLLDEEGLISEKKQLVWGEDGLKLKEMLFYSDDAFDTTTFEYNNNKLLVAKITVDEENELEKTEIFDYNGENLTKHIIKDSDNKITFEETYIYNEKNQLNESKAIDKVDNSVNIYKYSYDDKGNVEELLQYNEKNKLVYRRLYEYNAQNKVVKIVEEDAGNKNATFYEYDNHGNIIKEEEFNKLDTLNHALIREYDADNRLLHIETVINRHGYGKNIHYELTYKYN